MKEKNLTASIRKDISVVSRVYPKEESHGIGYSIQEIKQVYLDDYRFEEAKE